MADVIELRIHGVGGGTVKDILGLDPPQTPVAGDAMAGFYRHPATTGTPPRIVEAYVWGGFTSKGAIRALWMLLLPFTVINVAGWMVLPGNGTTIQALERAVIRVVAFGHTILVIAWLAAIGAEISDGAQGGTEVALAMILPAVALFFMVVASIRSQAYEQYGDDGMEVREDVRGPDDPDFWATGPFIKVQRWRHAAVAIATMAALVGGWMWATDSDDLGTMVVIAAVVVIAVEIALSAFRVIADDGYVALGIAIVLFVIGFIGAIGAEPMTSSGWTEAVRATPVLSEAPLAILLGMLALVGVLVLTGIAGWLGRRSSVRTWPRFVRLWMWRAAGLVAIAVLIARLIEASGGRWWIGHQPTRIVWLWLAGGLLVLILLLRTRRARTVPLAVFVLTLAGSIWLDAVHDNSAFLWAGPGVLIGLLFVTTFAETGRRDQFRWLPAATVAGLSMILPAVTYSAMSILVRGIAENSMSVPSGYRWIMTVFTAVFFVTLGSIAVHLIWRRLEVWRKAEIERGYSGECAPTLAKSAARWRTVSDGMRSIDLWLTALTWGTFGILIAALSRVNRRAEPFGSLDRVWDAVTVESVPDGWAWLTTIAQYVALGLPFVVVAVFVLAVYVKGVRRKVGIIWDVCTFWPRRFHPLAPPAYSERAVPQIVDRVKQLNESGHAVLIAGHSQGAVLTASALAQLTNEPQKKLAALTFGAPNGVYYRRFWPGTFGRGGFNASRAALRLAAGGQERWWNAYRLTDPIAEDVFSGPDEDMTIASTDFQVPDPPPTTGTDCPRAEVHSRYLEDVLVSAKMDEVGASLAAQP